MTLDQDLSQWLAPLLTKLEPAQRLQLMRQIARLARERNQRRIRAQIQPDGSRFTPRKLSLRNTGIIKKNAMFSKMRLTKFLKQSTSASESAIFWAGRTGRIGEMHHYGRQETIDDKQYEYPARHLLGLTNSDDNDLLDTVLRHLNS